MVEKVAKLGFHCQIEGYHHAFSDRAMREAKLYVERLCAEMLTLNGRDRQAMLAQMGNVAAWQLRSIQSSECAVKQVEGKTGIPTKLDKIEHLHSTNTIDTKNSGTCGRSVWVHSSQVRLLDSSVPHNSLPERVEPLGTGVARNLGT